MEDRELREGDYYWTKEGYRVFTEQYLLRRAYCCDNGCRHCPYTKNKTEVKGKSNQDGDKARS